MSALQVSLDLRLSRQHHRRTLHGSLSPILPLPDRGGKYSATLVISRPARYLRVVNGKFSS